ncbi:hypothetical protein CBL_09894 [Carabus blaptoides fortunei]
MSTTEGSSAGQALDTDRARQSDSNSQNTQVDPDTEAGPPNPKRPRLKLDEGKKVKVLTSLIEAYAAICKSLKITEEMMNENFTISHQVTIIMNVLHNICWSKIDGVTSSASRLTTITSFTVRSEGNLFTNTTETLIGLWTKTLENNGLQYRAFATDDSDNWFGTVSAYLNSSETFQLRLKEMRVGYNSMTITTEAGQSARVSVSDYGIVPEHYFLLEGISYAPERRIVTRQSMGPMTAFLCMIHSQEKYRKDWEEIVKHFMSLISCIDDIIEITKEKSACALSRMVDILASILLITIPKHATTMHFPMCMLHRIHSQTAVENRVALLKRFSCFGPGAYYFYKQCQMDSMKWVIEGNYTPEQAAQLVFHSIFGTFKEDLSLLEQITDMKTWFTRHQFKECLKRTERYPGVEFTLPKLTLYPKLSPLNQVDFLSTDVTGFRPICNRQLTSVSVFGGPRIRTFSQDFFDYIQRKEIEPADDLERIENVLSDILRKRQRKVEENKGIVDMGITSWRTMASLTLTEDGNESQDNPVAGRKYFSHSFE